MSPRPNLRERIATARQQRLSANRIRVRRVVGHRDGVRCEVDGRWLTGFCSNDYLGLAQQFGVVAALEATAAREGVGATASHLVCGHHAAHVALEQEIADWLQMPAALLFGSGYLANLAVVQALLGDGDVCVQDKLNHASLIDGARLAGCSLRRYPHADAEAALRQLRAAPGGAALLATDGVFSMDGDVAPLKLLALIARAQRALLYVDDAHGVGVIGPQGRGSVADAGLDPDAAPLQLVTLGKALGGHGAVLVGDADLVRHLAETARPYIYMHWDEEGMTHGRTEVCRCNSMNEAITMAHYILNSIPTKEDRDKADFMRSLANAIDKGKSISIDVEFLNPLKETMQRISENALTHQAKVGK